MYHLKRQLVVGNINLSGLVRVLGQLSLSGDDAGSESLMCWPRHRRKGLVIAQPGTGNEKGKCGARVYAVKCFQ